MNMKFPFRRPSIAASALAVLAIVSAGGAAFNSVANANRNDHPELALLGRSNDALALAAVRLRQMEEGDVRPATVRLAEQDAQRALAAEPLTPGALRLLGTSRELSRDADAARPLMTLAEQVSRRELGTQLWLIEDNVRRGDIRGALRHYDLALSTRRTAPDLLFPILANAVGDSQIDRELIPYIRAGRAWTVPFLWSLTGQPDKAADVARLFIRNGKMPAGLPAEAGRQLLGHLVNQGQFDLIKPYFALLPGASPALFSEYGFSRKTVNQNLAPLAWTLGQSDGVSVTPGKPGSINIDFGAEANATALHRVLMLTPGQYRLDLTSVLKGEDASTLGVWKVQCLIEGGKAGDWIVERQFRADRKGQRQSFGFQIGANCPAQIVTLSILSAAASGYGTLTVRDLSLRSSSAQESRL